MGYVLFVAWTVIVGFTFFFAGYNNAFNDITGLLKNSRSDEAKFKIVVDRLIEGHDE